MQHALKLYVLYTYSAYVTELGTVALSKLESKLTIG